MRFRISKSFLALALFASFVSVSHITASYANERLKVVTTFTVIADMAARVAGDAADVVSITKPGAEIHGYQPTPQDLVGASDADLILWNGLNLEVWFEPFLASLGDIPSVVISEGIEPMQIGGGPYKGKPNPHAWMSPQNAVQYVNNMANAFAKADPNNADLYLTNAKAYNIEVMASVAGLQQTISTIPETRRWLATSEGAFSYMARDLGLREIYLWPTNADAQGTPQQVRSVIDAVREHDIPAIFSESTVSDKPAKQVSRETGAQYGGVLYVDSLSEKGGPVPTFLDLLRVNADTIAKALGPAS